jgi:hypothetical protein
MKGKPIIRGQCKSRRIWINGKELKPGKSLKLKNLSPEGFCWGYGGPGPAQLALAILLELLDGDKATAIAWFEDFKTGFVQRLPQADFELAIPQAWAIRIARHKSRRAER